MTSKEDEASRDERALTDLARSTTDDLYGLLNLPSPFTNDDAGHPPLDEKDFSKTLSRAWRSAALQLHPDKNRGREAEAAEKYDRARKAHNVLSNSVAKAVYDGKLAEQRARAERQEKLDSRRKAMVEELERGEKAAATGTATTGTSTRFSGTTVDSGDATDKARRQEQEIQRLQAETARRRAERLEQMRQSQQQQQQQQQPSEMEAEEREGHVRGAVLESSREREIEAKLAQIGKEKEQKKSRRRREKDQVEHGLDTVTGVDTATLSFDERLQRAAQRMKEQLTAKGIRLEENNREYSEKGVPLFKSYYAVS